MATRLPIRGGFHIRGREVSWSHRVIEGRACAGGLPSQGPEVNVSPRGTGGATAARRRISIFDASLDFCACGCF